MMSSLLFPQMIHPAIRYIWLSGVRAYSACDANIRMCSLVERLISNERVCHNTPSIARSSF